jgi:hypothetical protein
MINLHCGKLRPSAKKALQYTVIIFGVAMKMAEI